MLALPATLNHVQASADWQAKALAANWQVDASALQHFDSSVLALLLDLKRHAQTANAKLSIYHAPHRLTQLATLYGVSELIA